uniref:AN1-type domain-containing protein n=1 Tax=Falco tinnunculus TaxID=100819 RepID=A0A8C4UH79_FALTI
MKFAPGPVRYSRSFLPGSLPGISRRLHPRRCRHPPALGRASPRGAGRPRSDLQGAGSSVIRGGTRALCPFWGWEGGGRGRRGDGRRRREGTPRPPFKPSRPGRALSLPPRPGRSLRSGRWDVPPVGPAAAARGGAGPVLSPPRVTPCRKRGRREPPPGPPWSSRTWARTAPGPPASAWDVQVPVCPLCNTPVPVRRGEMPDVVVGEHIDRDCKSDPAQCKRKIFTNKCLKPGCKQKEMMKVICNQCHKNYCLKHRHPLDHDCSGAGHPLSKAGHAAVARAQASSSKTVTALSSGAARPTDSPSSPALARGGRAAAPQTRSISPPAVMLQNGLSEEEALQRALEMSLAESACSSVQPPSTQEEEDLALAQALSASEAEYQQSQRQAHGSKPSNCSMS